MESQTNKIYPEKFGTVLGKYDNILVYSSDYASADKEQLPNRHAYRNYIDGIFMGYKWQCVELARRWMYLNKGYIFDDIAMAYDIFRLKSVRVIEDNSLLPLKSFKNGSKRLPKKGCLLIWNEGGEFNITGHVAIVTEVGSDYVCIIEQNVDHTVWPNNQNYSRQLKMEKTEDNGYWIDCDYKDSSIMGWVIQTHDATHAEEISDVDVKLFNIQGKEVAKIENSLSAWLDTSNVDEAAYVTMMQGHKLSSHDADMYKYFCLSETAFKEIKRATNELHALFMHATDFVLQDDKLLEKFNIPRILWPKIHQSWDNRRNQMITGRFDFSVSERGLKVYEYNADSASCHMECGKIQGKWAKHFSCNTGWDPGEKLHKRLVKAWGESEVGDMLHIMQDIDLEETYHALYMKSAMEKAGLKCKIIKGVAGLSWDNEGYVVDAEGLRIKWVWKTWAWETALDQIRAEFDEDEQNGELYIPRNRQNKHPRLVDVLLRPDVTVYEPFWTLIPSNKAILPILWMLFPNHPYLLNSQYEVSDELIRKGYVAKPIAGRCGANISIFDKKNSLVKETSGKFDEQDQIYQEFFKLPKVGGYNAQVCTFSVDGSYAGTCIRVDQSLVITSHSDLLAVRVAKDKEIIEDQGS